MSDPETETLISESTLRDDTLPPIRPVKEYEDILIREVSIGFASGVQDMTLYPEDVMEADEHGNIRIELRTLGGGEFVAYAGHTEWHSIREVTHKREKGTLRPDPKKVMEEYQHRRTRDQLDLIRRRAEADASE